MEESKRRRNALAYLSKRVMRSGFKGKILWQHLDGHIAVQLGIVGTIHLTHSSDTKSTGNLVMSKLFAKHEWMLINGSDLSSRMVYAGVTTFLQMRLLEGRMVMLPPDNPGSGKLVMPSPSWATCSGDCST